MKRLFPLLIILSSCSCNSNEQSIKDETSKKVESFDFNLRWSTHGNYMFDAKEGKICKSYLSEDDEKYSSSLVFSDDIKDKIIESLNSISVYSYPNIFDPYKSFTKEKIAQSPQYKIILDLNDKVIETIDNMPDINNQEFRSKCTKDAIEFFDCIEYITNYITNSEEWINTPDSDLSFL